jgi:hypothetical protein
VTDDNWKRLYKVIINVPTTTDEGTIDNALGFDELPNLVDPYAWLPDVPLFELGEPWTSVAPFNSPTEPNIRRDPRQSPRHANELVVPPCAEPVQPARNIYETATVTGSNAHRQQWLHQELHHSLCGSRLGAQDDGGRDPGGSGVS